MKYFKRLIEFLTGTWEPVHTQQAERVVEDTLREQTTVHFEKHTVTNRFRAKVEETPTFPKEKVYDQEKVKAVLDNVEG